MIKFGSSPNCTRTAFNLGLARDMYEVSVVLYQVTIIQYDTGRQSELKIPVLALFVGCSHIKSSLQCSPWSQDRLGTRYQIAGVNY